MNELVSIIIPNYNNAEFLESSVSSALSQDYKNIEVIVVDDGSSDDSVKILESFGTKIRLFQQPNLGAAAARNSGIKISKGDYLAFLDSDDNWRPSKITLQMKKMNSSHCGLVYCALQELFLNGSHGLIHNPKFEGNCYKFFKKYPSRAIIVGGCSTALIRKSILTDSLFFDESFDGVGEDLDFFRRVSRITKVGYVPEVLVSYRRHGASLSAVSTEKYFEGNIKAVVNLLSQDLNIGLVERRVIWVRLLFPYLKSFLREGDYEKSVKIMLNFLNRTPANVLD